MNTMVNHNQQTCAENAKRFSGHGNDVGRNRGIRWIAGILLACLIGIVISWQGEGIRSQAVTLTQGSEQYRNITYQIGDIELRIHVGLGRYAVRRERYAPIHVEIKNNGKDFEGKLRLYPDIRDTGSTEKRIVVEKQVQIAAGETKDCSCFLGFDYSDALQVALCDKQGKLLEENDLDQQLFNINNTGMPSYVWYGMISEDNTALSYLADEGRSNVDAVQDWMLTDDWRMLDCFDVLVINQFDTTQLSEKQITAINEWIKRGGTLVLGTGAQPEKTLKAFSGNLLQGTIGSTKKISTDYGTELDISELQLDHMKSVLDQGDDMLVGQMDYGNGSVLVASFDLASGINSKLAKTLESTCYLNMSAERRSALQVGEDSASNVVDYGWYDEFSISQALKSTEVNGLPNVMLYAVLLLLYAVFIGPILYSILRKRGKRELLWSLIPLSAVVCSVLIYLIGTSTRVKHPYVNYLSKIDLTNEEMANMQTYMMVTSPNNDAFDLELKEKDVISYQMGSDEDYYFSSNRSGSQSVNRDYKCRMEYLEDQTLLHMDNMSSFDSIAFRQKQQIKSKGQIQFADMNVVYNDMKGIVTNQSGYDLEQCALIYNGVIITLGNMKQGESVSLDQLNLSEAWLKDTAYDGQAAATAIGYDRYSDDNDVQKLRRAALLNQCMSNEGYSGNYYFYGFLKTDQDTEFTEQYDVDLYGETAVIQKMDSGALGAMAADSLAELEVFAMDLPDNYNSGTGLSTKEYTVHYDMESTGEPDLLQLKYSRAGNKEFNLLEQLTANPADAPWVGEYLFLGKVYGVNQKTGKREELFQAGKENVITDLSKYIDKNNQLELIYQIETLDEAQYPNQSECYDSFLLPRLILERKEVNHD